MTSFIENEKYINLNKKNAKSDLSIKMTFLRAVASLSLNVSLNVSLNISHWHLSNTRPHFTNHPKSFGDFSVFRRVGKFSMFAVFEITPAFVGDVGA